MTASGDRLCAPPRRTLYGRSRGKALRAAQERLLAESLPRFTLALDALAAGLPFDRASREAWLEIGFGSGEHLIAQALAHPDVGFIGCEPFLNGLVAALAAIVREGVANVRLRRGDAQTVIEAAPDAFFSRVFILYPDPWPKRRHHKRRFVSEATVEGLARVLKPGGELRFATDSDDYSGWTLKRILSSPHFRWTAKRADDWRIPWPDWRSTRYEIKAHKAGRGSVYLTFVRL